MAFERQERDVEEDRQKVCFHCIQLCGIFTGPGSSMTGNMIPRQPGVLTASSQCLWEYRHPEYIELRMKTSRGFLAPPHFLRVIISHVPTSFSY